jgi:hypothetical protein
VFNSVLTVVSLLFPRRFPSFARRRAARASRAIAGSDASGAALSSGRIGPIFAVDAAAPSLRRRDAAGTGRPRRDAELPCMDERRPFAHAGHDLRDRHALQKPPQEVVAGRIRARNRAFHREQRAVIDECRERIDVDVTLAFDLARERPVPAPAACRSWRAAGSSRCGKRCARGCAPDRAACRSPDRWPGSRARAARRFRPMCQATRGIATTGSLHGASPDGRECPRKLARRRNVVKQLVEAGRLRMHRRMGCVTTAACAFNRRTCGRVRFRDALSSLVPRVRDRDRGWLRVCRDVRAGPVFDARASSRTTICATGSC